MYLPPYSPDFNPIEECFSFLKAYIRRRGAEFRAAVESKEPELPLMFLYEAMDHVTPLHAQGWFHHSQYL